MFLENQGLKKINTFKLLMMCAIIIFHMTISAIRLSNNTENASISNAKISFFATLPTLLLTFV